MMENTKILTDFSLARVLAILRRIVSDAFNVGRKCHLAPHKGGRCLLANALRRNGVRQGCFTRRRDAELVL
jgi:hypothetical protein